MKSIRSFKVLRVVLAILFFTPFLLYFVLPTTKLPVFLHTLGHLQVVPAILNGMMVWIMLLLLLTLFFGRVYCSVLCPAGVLQDIINRLFATGKKKKKGSRRFRYHKPYNWLRYSLLALTVGLAFFGLMELCTLLDPYSNFGRIATNLFRPVVFLINNILADGLNRMDNYTLIHTSFRTASPTSIITASVALALFIGLVIWRGRLFCNTICPVGALLGLISRFSFNRFTFIHDKCTRCKACEHTCKAEAINAATLSVDMSRCVACFNCLSACKKDALHYAFRASPQKHINNSRRSFIATSATLAATVPVAMLHAQQNRHRFGIRQNNNQLPVTPPGSLSIAWFKDKCTACHLCVTQCPSNVLRPSGIDFGFDYMLKPSMIFNKSFCNYSCTVCSEVCPTGAIQRVTEEEKKTIQVGIAQLHIGRCIVNTEETSCGACSEHCTTQAVHMVPYKGILTIPQIEPELCIGCGGCESVCPVDPHRAIIVVPNKVHLVAELPPEEEKIQVNLDGFGF